MTPSIRSAAITALAFLAGLIPAVSQAADGTLGSTSTGSVRVVATINPMVQVSQLSDVSLGEWDGSSDLQGRLDFCVWSNSVGGAYSLEVRGGNGNFSISNGSESVPLDVQFRELTAGGTAREVMPGLPIAGLRAGDASVDCNNGANPNAGLTITVASAAMEQVRNRGQMLQGDLVLVVTPE